MHAALLRPSLLALCATAAISSAHAQGQPPLKVGLMLPATGTFAALGDMIERGFRLYVQEQGGKLGGRELEYFKVDDESEPAKATDNVNKLVKRDQVDVLVGTVHSGVALGMAKEGFDWIWCEHALTVGYRSSLTEIIQIIGRSTRDAPGKTRARFTNLIAEPDASETAITEAVVDSAETALFNAKLPPNEPKFLVVDGTTYSQLRQITRFSGFQTAGDAGLRALIDGSVGKIKDFFVFRSQFVKKTGSGPVTTHNLAFARSALGLVVRRLPQPLPGTGAIAVYAEMGNFGMRVVMSYQPNTLAQQFTVDVLYGVGVLRNSFGVQVNS